MSSSSFLDKKDDSEKTVPKFIWQITRQLFFLKGYCIKGKIQGTTKREQGTLAQATSKKTPPSRAHNTEPKKHLTQPSKDTDNCWSMKTLIN